MVPLVRMVGRGHFVAVSGTKPLGDAIHRGMRLEDRFVEMIEHAVGILAHILVMLADDLGRAGSRRSGRRTGPAGWSRARRGRCGSSWGEACRPAC